MSDDEPARPSAELEYRSVQEFAVRWADRTIEMVAMPYDSEAAVIVRGRAVLESCAPGAYDGVERRANRVKVNRDHDLLRTVGRAAALYPSRSEGLVTELRIAHTPLGDETLGLADDGALEPSVSFSVMPNGESWSTDRSRRRLLRLFLDHIAMVPEGAYGGEDGARVLAVRSSERPAQRPPALATPRLDEVRLWLAQDGLATGGW